MSGHNTEPTPLLGVGLPVFDGELFIAQAIESILAQTFQSMRLFVSDNCSSDGTAEICRTYAAKDARVVYSRNPENIGLVGNAVRVFRETRPSKYFALIGHDDFWAPQFAETSGTGDTGGQGSWSHQPSCTGSPVGIFEQDSLARRMLISMALWDAMRMKA